MPATQSSTATPPPPSYLFINITAPSYANWVIYANASNGWYAYYQGSGFQVFGPAYVGEPGTTVTFNVTSLSGCEYPLITYEPSSNITLSEGANYEYITIECVPHINATINVTSGGGVIAILSTPGFATSQSLIINGPTTQSLLVPMNTTLFIIAWPIYGYTLEGIYVNGTAINYTETPYDSFHAEVPLSSNLAITIQFEAWPVVKSIS
ncbi:hypothetical protein [Vulcanisaeta sp. JCM 14467]